MATSDYANVPELRHLFESRAQAKFAALEKAAAKDKGKAACLADRMVRFTHKEICRLGYEAVKMLGLYDSYCSRWAIHYAYALKGWDYYNLGEKFVVRILQKDLFDIKFADASEGKLASPKFVCERYEKGDFVIRCVSDAKEANSVLSSDKVSLSQDEQRKIREAKWDKEKAKFQQEPEFWKFLNRLFTEAEIKQKYVEGDSAALWNLPEVANRAKVEKFVDKLVLKDFARKKIEEILERGFIDLQLGGRSIENEDKEIIETLLNAERGLDRFNEEVLQKVALMKYRGASSHSHSPSGDLDEEEKKLFDDNFEMAINHRLDIEKFYQLLARQSFLYQNMAKLDKELEFLEHLASEYDKYSLDKSTHAQGTFKREIVENILAQAKDLKKDPKEVLSLKIKQVDYLVRKSQIQLEELKKEIDDRHQEMDQYYLDNEYIERVKEELSLDYKDIIDGMPTLKDLCEPKNPCEIDINDGKEFLIIPDGDVVKGEGGFIVVDFSECFSFFTSASSKKAQLIEMKQNLKEFFDNTTPMQQEMIFTVAKDGTVQYIDLDMKNKVLKKGSGKIRLYYDSAKAVQEGCSDKDYAISQRLRLEEVSESGKKKMVRRMKDPKEVLHSDMKSWKAGRRRSAEIDRQEVIATLKMFVDLVLSGKTSSLSHSRLLTIIEYVDGILKNDLSVAYKDDPLLQSYIKIFEYFKTQAKDNELFLEKSFQESLSSTLSKGVVKRADEKTIDQKLKQTFDQIITNRLKEIKGAVVALEAIAGNKKDTYQDEYFGRMHELAVKLYNKFDKMNQSYDELKNDAAIPTLAKLEQILKMLKEAVPELLDISLYVSSTNISNRLIKIYSSGKITDNQKKSIQELVAFSNRTSMINIAYQEFVKILGYSLSQKETFSVFKVVTFLSDFKFRLQQTKSALKVGVSPGKKKVTFQLPVAPTVKGSPTAPLPSNTPSPSTDKKGENAEDKAKETKVQPQVDTAHEMRNNLSHKLEPYLSVFSYYFFTSLLPREAFESFKIINETNETLKIEVTFDKPRQGTFGAVSAWKTPASPFATLKTLTFTIDKKNNSITFKEGDLVATIDKTKLTDLSELERMAIPGKVLVSLTRIKIEGKDTDMPYFTVSGNAKLRLGITKNQSAQFTEEDFLNLIGKTKWNTPTVVTN